MSGREKTCEIVKIRFVNFHNLGTCTLDMRDGGHLFLLGDNGSGKTTVLDAVHLVLTGGLDMEFNSAARVAGAKSSGGRKIQGVVMRYNIEKDGPMNPSGGIVYAALEVRTAAGKSVSLAVGFSARSMEEAYESWGVIADGAVEDLPLCVTEGERMRPARKAELKDAIGASSYYAHISAYRKRIAERFFIDENIYRDVCGLLATGKAYREIASRAGDYDKLFRELLQAPSREVFEQLICDLKSLEESRGKLERHRVQLESVENLARMRDSVDSARIDELAAQWRLVAIAQEENRAEKEKKESFIAAETERLTGLKFDIDEMRAKDARERARLETLRAKDADGLIAKEKDAERAVQDAKVRNNRAKNNFFSLHEVEVSAQKDFDVSRERLEKILKTKERELRQHANGLPFSVAACGAELDEALNATYIEDAVRRIELDAARKQSQETRSEVEPELVKKYTECEELQQKRDECASKLEELKKDEEAVPNIPGFADAVRAVREAMLDAEPLYKRLPLSITKKREIAELEQVIGEDALGTWLVSKREANELRQFFYTDARFAAMKIAVADEESATEEVPRWMTQVFDMDKVDPRAVCALARLVGDKDAPTSEEKFSKRILTFRGREEQAVSGAEARLLSDEARREARRKEIVRYEKDLAKMDAALRDLRREIESKEALVAKLTAFERFLSELSKTLDAASWDVGKKRGDFKEAAAVAKGARDELSASEEALSEATQALETIHYKMEAAGVERGLQDKIEAIEKQLRKIDDTIAANNKEIGRIENSIENAKNELSVLALAWTKQSEEKTGLTTRLAQMCEGIAAIDEFVAERCGTKDKAALNAFRTSAHDASVKGSESIRQRIRMAEMADFGFLYDENTNGLADRRGEQVASLLATMRREHEELSATINDDTRKIIKDLIMGGLIKALWESVSRLGDLTAKIQRLLRDRTFGRNRYSFAIEPMEGCRDLVRIVKNYHGLNQEETEDELSRFIEAHRDEIMNTEVGEIPAILDYRNWYRYELRIKMRDADDKVMDVKVKSMGSGGEQAVPNYLLILTIASFLYSGRETKRQIQLPVLIFDEAFYGIDAGRRDQLLAFATDLGLQLFVASPDQDGVKKEIPLSTSVLVKKDADFNVHLYAAYWKTTPEQHDLFEEESSKEEGVLGFTNEVM